MASPRRLGATAGALACQNTPLRPSWTSGQRSRATGGRDEKARRPLPVGSRQVDRRGRKTCGDREGPMTPGWLILQFAPVAVVLGAIFLNALRTENGP